MGLRFVPLGHTAFFGAKQAFPQRCFLEVYQGPGKTPKAEASKKRFPLGTPGS